MKRPPLETQHHPFCKYIYENTQGDWRCNCAILNEYEIWKSKNHLHHANVVEKE